MFVQLHTGCVQISEGTGRIRWGAAWLWRNTSLTNPQTTKAFGGFAFVLIRHIAAS